MIGCDPGDIVLVRFPFTDLTSVKKRPVLVISPLSYLQRYGDVVVIALTSQDQKDAALALMEWQTAGLPKPTWVKPLIGTLAASLIERRLGGIDPHDRHCVRSAMDMLMTSDWS